MGLRQWFYDLLSRGEPAEVDPDAVVEVALVPLKDGPLLVSALEREGIRASGIEAYDVVTDVRSTMRIMVHQRDLADAHDIIERYR